MKTWQTVIILSYGLLNFLVSIKGLHECKNKKNAFGLTYPLLPLGIFVWGDAVIYGLFWTLVSLTTYFLQDWLLFLLIIALFWVVRSLGETIYWFNQQFSTVIRQPAKKLPGYRFFHNDSIWFVYQIICQCITVVALVFSIYLTQLWLKSLG